MGPLMWISFKEPFREPRLRSWRFVLRPWDEQWMSALAVVAVCIALCEL